MALCLLALALLTGLYLSSQLTLALLKLAVPLHWDTYWSYVKALDLPQFAPYASKIKLAGAIGFGVPLLAWIALLIPLFKPKATALHGDARFASGSDLAKKDMLKPSPTGIVVGKHGGKLVRLPGQQFVILAAPTRSGKGVGIVIPNLL
ncbi:type IV secretory system conjugative DNA transfer family protein, partial [Xanthomonas campestris]